MQTAEPNAMTRRPADPAPEEKRKPVPKMTQEQSKRISRATRDAYVQAAKDERI